MSCQTRRGFTVSLLGVGSENEFNTAPGSVMEIRDETWLVNRVERSSDGWFVEVTGLSELVKGTQATFSTAIDHGSIRQLDPEQATVRVDTSPGFVESRAWLEAAVRKSTQPLTDPALTVAGRGLADSLPYQIAAVEKALDPANLRPRILLADAVGLGKTLEIGMILSELIRRGRGERILVVTPRHVLEQAQFELWTRFAIPFVRLDSVGIQRIRQLIPASRNPFAHFKRVIVSIDTLKSDRYLAHLEKQQWDAVVIDESHNVTNDSTQNNRLARLLATRTDALILASATPHNGRKESFAELIRMLDPSAVRPDGELIDEEVQRLVIRRHRHSEDVANIVGANWAERQPPHNLLAPANAIETEIADELETVWLHPVAGRSPYAGTNAKLFPWTLAKAFLSSPAALAVTVKERLRKLGDELRHEAERRALERLQELAARNSTEGSSKYDKLVEHLKEIGIGATSPERVVIFAERVDTLHWLRGKIAQDFKLKDGQARVLHGGISDIEQQEIVESFKQETSPIRVLVTGDVASEGVNLHLQCHELVHYDIPWSLIRIEQRNGRIDRYGQRHSPRITALLLDTANTQFSGDLHVLTRLIEREHEAHKALGDSASLMGEYSVEAESEAIRKVLAKERTFDDTVKNTDEATAADPVAALLAGLLTGESAVNLVQQEETTTATSTGVYDDDLAFLHDALEVAFETPTVAIEQGGVAWTEHPGHGLVELSPPADLRKRLEILPQSYLKDRHVTDRFQIAVTKLRGNQSLTDARADESDTTWPRSHYLSPLHPVLEWAADRVMEKTLDRNEIFAITTNAGNGGVLLHGTMTNTRGQTVAATYVVVTFLGGDPAMPMPQPFGSIREALAALGVAGDLINTNGLQQSDDLDSYIAPAVRAAKVILDGLFGSATEKVTTRIEAWNNRVADWLEESSGQAQIESLRYRRMRVEDEHAVAEAMSPDRTGVRPLLLVLPTTNDEGAL